MSKTVFVLNGPNLGRLGTREPQIDPVQLVMDRAVSAELAGKPGLVLNEENQKALQQLMGMKFEQQLQYVFKNWDMTELLDPASAAVFSSLGRTFGQVTAAAVRNGDGGRGPDQQRRHRSAHDIGTADHDGLGARNVAQRGFQQPQAPQRGAGHEAVQARCQPPGIHGVEAIHILVGRDRGCRRSP